MKQHVYDWVGFEADCWALDCLDDDTLVALAEGTLDAEARAAALQHVESCSTCSALVGQAARSGSDDRATLGRYRIIEQIGVGGMGRVYLAYDPALEREVALKLLDIEALDPAVGSARLVKEAQTLAGLDHPSICRVFDIQAHDDAVFIAMELLRGKTFAAWLATRPDPAAIVNAFVRAGEGLAAAHEAGIVHRDFKPSNAMIDEDARGPARVAVLDFGLARRERVERVHDTSADDREEATQLGDDRRTGSAFAGTPIYMAPEQYEGNATAASDQYAFCLALVEALARRFPFAHEDMFRLRRAKLDKAVVRDVVDTIPTAVRKPLLRGLEPDPQARWPSMRALLEALASPPRKRWPMLAAAAGVVVVGSIAVYVLGRPPSVQCDRADEGVTAVWNDTSRAELAAAFASSGAPGATAIAAKAEAELDDKAQHIAAAYRDACRETRDADALFDARARCLDRRLRQLDAALTTLQQLDAKTAAAALTVVDGLTEVDRCADQDFLLAMEPVPDDPRVAASVAAVEAELDRAEGELRVGRHREARPLFEHAAEEARALEHDPLVTKALVGLAADLRLLDDPRVVEIAEEAHTRARLVRDYASAARAAIELVLVLHRRGALKEAGRWIEEADIDADRADVPKLRAQVLDARAALAYANNDFEDALALRREALEIHATLDPEGLAPALAMRDIANTLLRLERFDEAIDMLVKARATLVAILGTDSARVAEMEAELGTVYMVIGQPDVGIPYLERGLPIVAQQEGEHSRSMFSARVRLANAYQQAGRLAESAEQSGKGIEMLEAIEHSPREAAIVWMSLGKARAGQGNFADALAAFEKARGIIEATEEAGPMANLLLMNIEVTVDVLEKLGRAEEAQVMRERLRVMSAPE